MSLLSQIQSLEKTARLLEPDQGERQTMAATASKYVNDFIELSKTKNTFADVPVQRLREMTVTEQGKPLKDLLDIFHNDVNLTGINTSTGGHLGYVPGSGIWSAAVADFLAAGTNRYSGVSYSSPGAVVMENQMIRWLSNVMGYPAGAHGNLTSGGSIAHLTALQTARDHCNINSSNIKKSCVYFTGQVHHSVHKALRTLGLHEAVLRTVPMTIELRMNASALDDMVAEDKKQGLLPLVVIASAGTTDAGMVDPLNEIAEICDHHNVWFHVDGAYGALFVLVDELKTVFKGIERSDSVILDPHKSLFIPYGTGAVLIKDGSRLLNTYSHQASYMQDTYGMEDISPADSGVELTRHFRAMRMWLPLHLHGLEVFRANLREKMLLCRYFHDEVAKMGFETGPIPDLSITRFRYAEENGNEINQHLIELLHDDGRCFFSSTMIEGKVWIRCAVLNFRTHLQQIEVALQMVLEAKDLALKNR